jgi:hypothetical protein
MGGFPPKQFQWFFEKRLQMHRPVLRWLWVAVNCVTCAALLHSLLAYFPTAVNLATPNDQRDTLVSPEIIASSIPLFTTNIVPSAGLATPARCLNATQQQDSCTQEHLSGQWLWGDRCRHTGTFSHVLSLEDMQEQFTVIIMVTAARVHMLAQVLQAYDGRYRIAEILVLWGPPGVPPPTASSLGVRRSTITFLIQSANQTMNDRYGL